MNTFELLGIDGSNPLGFMAAMGVLRVGTLLSPNAAMHWELQTSFPYPILAIDCTEGDLWKHFLAEAKFVAEHIASPEYGDIIKTGADKYRKCASSCDTHPLPRLPYSDFYASFAAETVRDNADPELVAPSMLSFSNSGANQFLLKDFRSLVAKLSPAVARVSGSAPTKRKRKDTAGNNPAGQTTPVGPELLKANLLDNRKICHPMTNLNWDPNALRSYALLWADPANRTTTKKETDVPLNVAAFLGFGAFPSVQVNSELVTAGCAADGHSFSWPLWRRPVRYHEAAALLLFPERGDQVWESRRFSSNKRFYFSPAVCRG